MHCFGLTGGIASGKSAVARVFAAHGVAVVDADTVARDVVAKGSPGLTAVIARFGEEVLAADGTLDRKRLGSMVFQSRDARRTLEEITHPLIRARTATMLAELASHGTPLACYEAALLVESGVVEMFRPLVVVTADLAARLERVKLRDGLSAEEAENRMRSQASDAERCKVADYVIVNDGSLLDLEARTLEVLALIRAKFATSTSAATEGGA